VHWHFAWQNMCAHICRAMLEVDGFRPWVATFASQFLPHAKKLLLQMSVLLNEYGGLLVVLLGQSQ